MAVWPHTGCYRAFLAAVTGLSPPGLKQGSHTSGPHHGYSNLPQVSGQLQGMGLGLP